MSRSQELIRTREETTVDRQRGRTSAPDLGQVRGDFWPGGGAEWRWGWRAGKVPAWGRSQGVREETKMPVTSGKPAEATKAGEVAGGDSGQPGLGTA